MESTKNTFANIVFMIFGEMILLTMLLPIALLEKKYFSRDSVSFQDEDESLIVLIHGTGINEENWFMARLYLRLYKKKFISVLTIFFIISLYVDIIIYK